MTPPVDRLSELLPYTGWLVALVLFVLRKVFERFFAELGSRLAGPFFRWFASRDLMADITRLLRAGTDG